MLQIYEIVKKTEEMFDLFNQHFYSNKLTRTAITVSPDGGRGAYGWCSIHEIWNAENELYREINLCAEYLDRPITNQEASTMEISYNVTGPRRKELATAVGDFIGTAPVYQKAPTYAFAIGIYIIDRNGTLSGEKNEELTEALAAQGFTAA